MRRRHCAFWGSFLLISALGFYAAYLRTTEVAKDAYASWWVGEVIVEYMSHNDGRWPRNWDDLRSSYRATCFRVGNSPWTFEELRERILVDFTVNPEQLRSANGQRREAPCCFIRSADGRDVSYERAGGNDMIWGYIRTHGGEATKEGN